MRRVFIAFGITVFLIYCWASVAFQNHVAVPTYTTVKVDILGGGKSRSQWDADERYQFQRLMELEGANYELPKGMVIKIGASGGFQEVKLGDGQAPGQSDIGAGRPLVSDDYSRIIAATPSGAGLTLELLDSSAFSSLLAKNYLLRDPIADPANPDGKPLYDYDHPLTKKMLDDLSSRGVTTITVTGHGPPVTFQVGTSLMVAIIFLTLVAALKPVIWTPFIALLERRRKELEMGSEAQKQNVTGRARFEEEKRSRNAKLFREVEEIKMRGQREAAGNASDILKRARDGERAEKQAGFKAIKSSASEAEAALRSEVPELAEAIVKTLMPKRPAAAGGDPEPGPDV